MKPAIALFIAAAYGAALLALIGAYSGVPAQEAVIHITAKRFQYSPSKIVLKKGVPVTLELTALDRLHGFSVPQLGLRADVLPGQTVRVHLVPAVAGTFAFHCDIFCGEHHDQMLGIIVVE